MITYRLGTDSKASVSVNGQDERRINAPPLTVLPVFANSQSRRESPKTASCPFQNLENLVMEGVAMCDYCHNIQKWKRFNAPKDYLACIEYIQQLVTNGGFELLEEESTCPLNQVKTEDGWADEIMVHMVRCKHCGQVFTCVVNTYRGSGSFKKGNG